MNERIEKLANEAGVNLSAFQFSGTPIKYEIAESELERFAELIVQECVKLCEHESNDDEYDQYDMGMSVKAEDIKASIMKTFGVK